MSDRPSSTIGRAVGFTRARTRALVGAGLVILLVLAPLASAGSSLVTEITNASANERNRMKVFDTPATALGDFDGDGRVELVGHNENRYVYVMATDRPHVYAEFSTPYPDYWSSRSINDPAVGDVDADGRLDIVVVNSAAYTCRFEYDPEGSSSTGWHFVERWCHRADWFESDPAADGGPRLADVTGDGNLEVFMQTEDSGLFAYDADGSVRWALDAYGGNAGPLVTDLENDGAPDVAFFSDGGTVRAVDARDGSAKWTVDVDRFVWPASIPVAGNAADLDNDGKKEVVLSARHAEHTDDYQKNDVLVVALEHDGRVKWTRQPSWANPLSYTHPVLYDVNGDGTRDVVMQDWNTIGHKPGNWERFGTANVFALSGDDGSTIWRTELPVSWSNDDVGLADADADGALEVLAVGKNADGASGVWYLDAATGAKEQHVTPPVSVVMRGPTIGDFDGTGDLDWAVSIKDDGGGYVVYDTSAGCWVPYGGFQNPNPCNPTAGRDGSTGGGSDGDFTASFSTPGGNEWWVEVYVDASRSLAGVDARVDGGSWIALEHKSWGAWAKSFHVPDGSIVEFRARADTGEHVVSDGYVWPDGTKASEGGGSFSATFSEVEGGEWWVEVDVSASDSLAGVDARVDGGSWIALEHKSWGDWARDIHVPDGSHVEFRARATTGETATSQAYVWPSNEPADSSGSGFSATFENVRGNEWWVETDVSSTRTITAVSASVNGGDRVPLEKQDWGSWAKSFHVPSGSSVQFRAADANGNHAFSDTYAWPPG